LTGIHTYDLLRNPSYIQAFQYYSADLPDRDAFIIDDDDDQDNNNAQSDYVRILMSLAYIKPHELDHIDLSKDAIMKKGARGAKDAQVQIDRLRKEMQV